MAIIAVIPAKGTSRRLPGKNMRPFCGKPLVEWTLIQCKYSRYVGKIYLVTDSQEIAELGEKYDAKIVWQTKEQIDKAEADGAMGGPYSEWMGIEAAMEDEPVNGAFTLLPTTPLRRVADLDDAVDVMRMVDKFPVFSMREWRDCHLFNLNGNIATYAFVDKSRQLLRTDASVQFWLVNHFTDLWHKPDKTWRTVAEILAEPGKYPCTPVFHEVWQDVDIDEQADLEVAEYWMERKILQGKGEDAYKEYHTRVMSEFGWRQNAAQYNKGVEANLLPFEYKFSFYNHFPLFLQSQRDEKIAGYELVECFKDGLKKPVFYWRSNSAHDALAKKLENPEPALIVGSGPSLDDAGKYLKDWKGACFCSTSQATTLAYYGLNPSHIVAYDINSSPDEIKNVDIPWETRGTKLIIHPGVNPQLHSYWRGDKLLFRSMDTSNYFMATILPIAYGDIIPSQMFLFSCSIAAQISLAKAMGYSPLFLVGCDFQAARFSRWQYIDGEWKCEEGKHASVNKTEIIAANGMPTDALSVFYKRSTLCVWRIDHSQCFITSPQSIITEMPQANIEAVIAYQGKGFEGFTDQQIEDAAEIYLSHFNQFIIRFGGDDGKGVKVVESGAGEDKWEQELEGYMGMLNKVSEQEGKGRAVDISSNLERFRWLKTQASLPAEPKSTVSLAG